MEIFYRFHQLIYILLAKVPNKQQPLLVIFRGRSQCCKVKQYKTSICQRIVSRTIPP